MLVVVAKEVATSKGPKVIEFLTSGKMFVAGFVRSPVRQIGAKKEKLKGGQHSGYHPENDQVFGGDYQL